MTLQVHNEFAKRMESENARQNARIEELENTVKEIQTLTVSVEKMAVSVEHMATELRGQSARLESIEKEPAERWKSTVTVIVGVLVTAILTYMLSRIGL